MNCCPASRESRLAAIVVVHVNHPAEIDDSVAAAFGRLVDAGIPVLSQGVLLRGVNDRLEILAALVRTAGRSPRHALLSASFGPRRRRGPF